jgi:uncharacterized membrane protein HdeD (DUF308 family)
VLLNEHLLGEFVREWWLVALRGLVAIIFGALVFAWVGLSLFLLVTLWGVYALADGVFALAAAFRIRDRGKALWSLFAIGLSGIVAGGYALTLRELVAADLPMTIGAWALSVGMFQILAAMRLHREVSDDRLLDASGALSMIFGLKMILSSSENALALSWSIAGYPLAFGALLTIFAFRLKQRAAIRATYGEIRTELRQSSERGRQLVREKTIFH